MQDTKFKHILIGGDKPKITRIHATYHDENDDTLKYRCIEFEEDTLVKDNTIDATGMRWEDTCTDEEHTAWMESPKAVIIYGAGSLAKSRKDCPYAEGTKEYYTWMQGWESDRGLN